MPPYPSNPSQVNLLPPGDSTDNHFSNNNSSQTSLSGTITADEDNDGGYEDGEGTPTPRGLEEGRGGGGGGRGKRKMEGMGGGGEGSGSGSGSGGGGEGLAGMWRESSHPIALLFLYLFRTTAIITYLLCGYFSNSYVLSTVIVVTLLSCDFWTVRNVSGRVLVGLRFWNQVDEDGTSYWVFESRDPTQPANKVDSKMFWTALYIYPLIWFLLLFTATLTFSLSFLPIVLLALVFNVTNAVGFTYADRDAKQRWATSMAASSFGSGGGGMLGSALGAMGGMGGNVVGGLVRGGMGKVFG